jgi:RNA polymerase sigma factor (TIGR02999 family)
MPLDPASTVDVQSLIQTADAGNASAADQLFAALYDELHQLAERQLRLRGGGVTLGTTTLLHEAYLNLANRGGVEFPDRSRFLAYAARAMRGLIVDYARRRRAFKRGGEFRITSVDAGVAEPAATAGPDVEQLSEALETLARADRDLAELVDLHFFAGFSLADIAALRRVSERTTQRDWRKARLLLHRSLASEDGDA